MHEKALSFKIVRYDGRTKPQYLSGKSVSLKPFVSRIEGLVLNLDGNGSTRRIPIRDTSDIIEIQCNPHENRAWFEFDRSDRDYDILLIMK